MPAHFANLAVVAVRACVCPARERGQTLVEYSLLLMLLAMVAVATLSFATPAPPDPASTTLGLI
jgi:hypothetical protein